MKYNIGDIVKLIDGIDYNGDSLTYSDGRIAEIINCLHYKTEFRYKINGFYRGVTQDEIEKRIYTNKQKIKKFGKYLSFINKKGYLVYETGEIEQIKIIGYSFIYNDYIIKSKRVEGCPFNNQELFTNKLLAYEYSYKVLIGTLKKAEELFKV